MRGGVLLLDKGPGKTSAWCARRAGRLAGHGKAGHLGTLDPMATGLLVVLLGEATRFAQFAAGLEKSYRARVTFGMRTDTDDTDGRALSEGAVPGDLAARVEALLPGFAGRIRQRVPAYSSHKHEGRAFHRYARAGVEPPVRHKDVVVESIALLGVSGNVAELDIRCGPGTYVRAIARDLGEMVGCGAALSGLSRTSVGDFSLRDAVPLGVIEAGPDAAGAHVRPVDAMLSRLPSLTLGEGDVRALACGRTVAAPAAGRPAGPGGPVCVRGPGGEFAGVGEMAAEGTLRPRRMLRRP